MELVRSGYAGNTDTVFAKYRGGYRKMSEALPQDARVVLHSARPCLGIDRDLTYDITGAQGLISYAGIAGPRELYDYYRSLGFTHLLYPPNSRPPMIRQADILFLDLVHHHGVARGKFADYMLVELPQTPPPVDSGYDVLMLGMDGYRDGLYPVESLSTAQKGSLSHQTFADPLIETAPDDPKLVEMLQQVRAVAVRGSVPPSIRSALSRRFMVAARYHRAHTVYLLKSGNAPTSVR
jgi:hypothetical protein